MTGWFSVPVIISLVDAQLTLRTVKNNIKERFVL